jgi:restriction system protein
MARSRRSPDGNPPHIRALPPWWIFVLLAGVSFAVLHWLAQPVEPLKDPGKTASFAVQSFIRALALVGQFAVPPALLFIGLLVAIGAARNRGKAPSIDPGIGDISIADADNSTGLEPDRYGMWKETNPGTGPSAARKDAWSLELLRILEWKRFEEVCAAYFEALGFRSRLARAGADGGVDVHLYQPESRSPCILVQCKAWRVYKVGVAQIRELFGVMAADRVGEGILVTTGAFTPDARSFAEGKNIHLIDGAEFIQKVTALAPEKQTALLNLATAGDFTTPTCASCGIKMIRRRPRNGGEAFWGCINYPRCRTILKAYSD